VTRLHAGPVLALALLAACAHAGPPRAASTPEAPAPPLLAGPAPSPAPASPPPTRITGRITLAAVGDVLMHDAVKRSAATFGAGAPDAGFSWLYEPVADLLARVDLAFANLETPIAPKGGGTREFVFNATADAARALQRSGIDVVAVANNHAFDQGRSGFEETLATLDGLGLRRTGAGPAQRPEGPEQFEIGGFRIALLGWSRFFNQDGNECPRGGDAARCLRAAQLDPDRAVEAVKAAARDADFVVVSLHWGEEYQQQPRAEDVELAHRLADAGASVLLGHHPHVLQPIELYRRADGKTSIIAYSLGNFVSNQSRGYVFGVTPDKAAATRDGALLEVELVRRDYGRGVVEAEVGAAGYVALWTENDTAEIDPRKEPTRRPRIRVVAVDRALAEVRAGLAGLPDPVRPERRSEWLRLRNLEALYVARKEAIARVLGGDLERAVAPPAPGPTPATASPPAR
jgi:poly-gamma-glutamate synthesis protein (capsule biosynthesis protein)